MADTSKIAALVGAPFVYGGRGPEEFDCYGLLMHIMREQRGVALPDHRSTSDMQTVMAKMAVGLHEWKQVPAGEGAAVLIRVGNFISHCGYMIDPLRMIHTWEKSGGVVIERVDHWQRRIVGFYEYVGNRS